MKTRTLEQSIQKLQARLARRFPGLEFEVEVASPKEATIYFFERESEDWYDVIEAAGGPAVDILVDYGHWIHVQPRFKEPVAP
jgi:hypothetical protein